MTVAVTGAGGFIGGHLVRNLLEDGEDVLAIDSKPYHEWHQLHEASNMQLDCSLKEDAEVAVYGVTDVYDLAADMGGIGFIEGHKAECMLSVLTGTHLLMAARDAGVERFFYASSACVYASKWQQSINTVTTALAEDMAYPADPEDGYGWEKLFTERMCRHFTEDYGLATRVGRFHNIAGPFGTWTGGREKAPAALCRKVAEAKLTGGTAIEVWGDGEQTRSFCWVGDCVDGIRRLMASDYSDPVNIGSAELVSINELIDIIEDIAGVHLERRYDLAAPQGVRGRNSDNTLCRKVLGWEPSTALADWLAVTYEWIEAKVAATLQ